MWRFATIYVVLGGDVLKNRNITVVVLLLQSFAKFIIFNCYGLKNIDAK
jgi:hypothetical protein